MDVVADFESPGAFYRVEEGGKTMSWRRNDGLRVKFCFHFGEKRGMNITHFERGKEDARLLLVLAQRGDRRIQRRSIAGVGRHLDWPEVKGERLFGPDTVVRSNRLSKIECAGKERFLCWKKIVEKNLSCHSLNKK
jgi:hypothetical protein